MIRHIVWWTLKKSSNDNTPFKDVWHFVTNSKMLHASPNVTSVQVSEKIEPSTTVPCGFVLTTTHKNIEDLEAFRGSPVYGEFIDLVMSGADQMNVIDFADDQDPALEGFGKPVA